MKAMLAISLAGHHGLVVLDLKPFAMVTRTQGHGILERIKYFSQSFSGQSSRNAEPLQTGDSGRPKFGIMGTAGEKERRDEVWPFGEVSFKISRTFLDHLCEDLPAESWASEVTGRDFSSCRALSAAFLSSVFLRFES